MRRQARDLICGDCHQSFPFSIEDQGLGAELGFDQPRRCRSCRRLLEDSRRAFRHDAGPPLSWLRAASPDSAKSVRVLVAPVHV
jgi:hypothetical protein